MFKQVLLFAILATVKSQLVSKGSCNFTIPFNSIQHQVFAESNDNVIGYEIKRIENTWLTGQCASWQMVGTPTSLIVISSEVAGGKHIERNGTAAVNPDYSINIVFPDFTSNFTFLHATNDSTILYACSNKGENKEEYAWVLGLNTTTLSASDKNASDTALKTFDLDKGKWLEISHSKEACNGGVKLILSPILVLIVGFLVSKEI